MDAVSDDLIRPLGLTAPRRPRRTDAAAGTLARIAAPLLGSLLLVTLSGLLLDLTFVNDPLGGQPHALVSIEIGPQPAEPVRSPAGGGTGPGSAEGRSAASEVESASGVSVVRPAGGEAPPGAIIIRVPDKAELNPAPDPRLVERSRVGPLPKRSGEGLRALDVYARPVSPQGAGGPRIALVVTGLGIGQTATAEAIAKLAAPVTLAFAPYGADLERNVARARDNGHEVMLQAPMEPFDYPDNDPGPHTLLTGAKLPETIERLHWIMSRFTGYIGLVNFMGAKLMADEAAMSPILRELGTRGLGFLDDGSSPRSLAGAVAGRLGTPTARADAVIDAVPRGDAIERELAALESLAKRRGFAVGAASALPLTIERIARWTRTLEAKGIRLVPVSSTFASDGPR